MLDDTNYQGPSLSLQTALNLLGGNPSENTPVLLVNIIQCLTETIKKHERDHKVAINSFDDILSTLQDLVLHYEETFSTPPAGYVKNNGHYPNLQILTAWDIYWPAKWVKQMDNLRVACLTDLDVRSTTPSIINVFACADHSDWPVIPMPDWLVELITGTAATYTLVKNNTADLNDWGITADLDWFWTAYNQMVDAYKQVNTYSALASMHA